MPAADTLIVFVKNEKGIAMPMYIRSSDMVDMIWNEVGFSKAINESTLKGKGLFFNGKKLERGHTLSDYDIKWGDVVRIQKV
uniref:Ubiquitin-like domain-containing protein n=1 Tax=Panagrellus redivivus TaxID=6233 RepID=A0A7E4W9B6_PANRE